jgi:hypothetical protein
MSYKALVLTYPARDLLQRQPLPQFKSQLRVSMDEQRKYAILFSATTLAVRKLTELGDNPRRRGRRTSRTRSVARSSLFERLISDGRPTVPGNAKPF